MKYVLMTLSAVLFAAGMTAEAAATFAGQVAAQEFRVRDGLGHTRAKIAAGKPVKIGYFGGSITEMDGYRRLSREWLQSQYPACMFSEIPAGVGGTGSALGVFRYGQDVLQHKPDLVFVEFATNDRGDPVSTVWKNFEGIVRQTWNSDPEIDIVFLYTVISEMVPDYTKGLCPTVTSAMEQLADAFGIPSVCFGPRVVADVNAGKLVMSVGEAATAVPEETPNRDQAIIDELAKEGKMLFAKDGVHPVLEAARAYYLESIKAAWPAISAPEPADHAAKLATVFYDRSLEEAKMVPIERGMLMGTWRQIAANETNGGFAGRFGDKPWFTETPGSKIKFRFRGSQCIIYDLFGPDCGQVWITVDGCRQSRPVARFDSWSNYYRLTALPVASGAYAEHDVEVELDAGQPSRASVSESASNPAKYDGTKWYPGRLLLVGDIVTPLPFAHEKNFWFNARVEEYAAWPRDATFAEGGQWTAGGASLESVASLSDAGALEISTGVTPISFQAEEAKTIGLDTRKIVLTADINLEAYANCPLPDVPEGKGAVVVGQEADGAHYYGLAKVGIRNEWVRLEGPAAQLGSLVRLTMTFGRTSDGLDCVTYNIGGTDYAYQGATKIPFASSGAVTGVNCSGFGYVCSLTAFATPQQGMAIIVQ